MAYFELENISFSYDESAEGGETKKVIDGVSLEIEKGSFVCVLGHNGSGKSTLAKILNLVLTPTSGRLVIGGKEVSGPEISEDEIFDIRRRIGMVFQNPDNQLVTTIVEEDVAFGPENLGVDPEEIRQRVDSALQTVGMSEYAKHSTHQLSGGQKQRVAIAGVLAMQPECIIFDESTAMLDPIGRRDIMSTIEYLNREREITVIHITHNMDEAVRADRIIVINDGKIYLDGTAKEVFSSVEKLRRVGLDVPQVTDLFYDLSPYLDLPSGVIDIEEGAAVLADRLKNGKA
ncbi:MAG: energy-coupling factor transporter ATPase [Clostridia bacterium]|nr:energy-coupling factor transporter ATPase [Clostridia bacterium]